MAASSPAGDIITEIDCMINLLTDSSVPAQQKRKPAKKQKAVEVVPPDTSRRAGSDPNDCALDIDERVSIALSVGEECIGKGELKNLLAKKQTRPIAYDGFEPSGRMHIAQGILKAINVNKLTMAGCDFVFWIADWFALLNNKMGGDLDKIRTVGLYMIEVWKAAGMDMRHVYFRWCSDDINANSNEYWLRVIEISKMFTINRTKRCCTILGRKESNDMPTANLMYACMQCADIFFLKADICQLGLDQRKVNMLAREYATKAMSGGGKKKKKKQKIHPPIILSHHMLMGLQQGTRKDEMDHKAAEKEASADASASVAEEPQKMSKSVVDSAIFMEDSADDVRRKIKKAYGPPGVVDNNPLLDFAKHLVFPKFGELVVERKPDNGGIKAYKVYKELEDDYSNGVLHPGDLKPALAASINKMIEPVRLHFKTDPAAKKLLAKVKKLKVTR